MCAALKEPGKLTPLTVCAETAIFLNDKQGCPGWCVLVVREHVEHMDEMDASRQQRVFAEVARVARALRQHFGPVRINYECLGNQVHHVHWHVIPRYANDPDPKNAIWGWPAEQLAGRMSGEERNRLASALKSLLER
jgi:diadenosine tetraphosphate (Ap4A) HIT family hydrolase